MGEDKALLQWLRSYINGLNEGIGQTDYDEDWFRGARWALDKVENHLVHLIYFQKQKGSDNGDNQGRED